MSTKTSKWPRPATAAAVADTIVRMGGPEWAKRSELPPAVRKQFELAYGFSNAFFAAAVNGEWRVASSRMAALDAATPRIFVLHRKDILAGLARDHVLKFADPVPVGADHPAAKRLRAMLADTPYQGKSDAKIYVIRGHGAPEEAAQAEGADEEKAFIAYLAVRAARLSPDGQRTFKDIAGKL